MNNPFKDIPLIGLDYILPNPYQPREHEDPLHVARVAESILQRGLLQPPVGRYTSLRRCELAFGHTRAAAYRYLTRLALHGESDGIDLSEFPGLANLLAMRIRGDLEGEASQAWLYLPVNMREIDDLEMFQMAISENLDRHDLNPLEVAAAMRRYESEFGKTSEQIGDLFGLSGPAVRNKMRLLDLPDEYKSALRKGELTEGAARAILRLRALPKSLLESAEGYHENECKPSKIEKDALNGAAADSLLLRINTIIQFHSHLLNRAPWKAETILKAAETGLAEDLPACLGCAQRVQSENEWRCLDRACFQRKQAGWEQRYQRKAAEACGYPELENGLSSHTTFSHYNKTEQAALAMAQEAHCPNLRVAYNAFTSQGEGLAGYLKAQLVCMKRNGFCTCQQAAKAGLRLTPESEVQPAPVKAAEQAQPESAPAGEAAQVDVQAEEARPAITAEKLSEVAREARKKKRDDLVICRQLRDRMADRVGWQLVYGNPGALRMMLNHANFTYRQQGEMDAAALARALGLLAANHIANPENAYDPWEPAGLLEKYNQALQEVGLPALEIQETPE